MKRKEDFLSPKYRKYHIVGVAALALLLAGGGAYAMRGKNPSITNETNAEPTMSPQESQRLIEESLAAVAATEELAKKEAVINSFTNLGVVKVEGFLNIRNEASQNGEIIGKLYNGSGAEILDESTEGWLKIQSGEVEGFISSEFVLRGEEAKAAAMENIKPRAVVNADRLNVRKEPSLTADVVDAVYQGERYEVLDQTPDGWIKIHPGYISSEFAKVEESLNTARKLDLKSMVLNRYAKLGISNVTGYLNIRKEPKADGEIIGKFPSKAAGDIIETLDGWYKIQSGPLTGYVSAEYILTGDAAKEEALKTAELMAVVKTDVLNVRTEPNKEATIWTQITNLEKYPVVTQKDGWVEIELENDNNAFVATDFVDVQYSLNEAIKFSPAEEARQAAASRRQQIVNYAMQFLGNPYVWGGTSLTKGCDCSGFTLSVLGKFGYGLPHYSVSQSQMGKKIDSSQMKPGDLIFYSNKSGTINHVSMYIGNGQVIHAASRRSGIKISAWNYRKPTTIRNIIGD